MKILIDIGHPAHVHYFKNFIKIIEKKEHEILITARNKEVTFNLLKKYQFKYISRGKGSKNLFGKFFYIFYADFLLLRIALKHKPDVFLSFASPYAAHVSWLIRKSAITLDDTEHAKLNHTLYKPFTKIILTPSCIKKDFGRKQLKFSSYMELAALHPKYFKANVDILKELRIKENQKYIFIRFVSWDANHDVGQSGLSLDIKKSLVTILSKYAKVLISSEGELPDELKQYQVNIPPEKVHDVISFADLYIGEGATMASECAVLGTPAIYINSLELGYCSEEEEKYNLLFNFRNTERVIEKAIELLETPNLKQEFQSRRQKMLADKIDVTAFMVWFIENYPESVKIMKENPDYQYNFK